MVLHCVTYGGGNDKIIFGKGTNLIVETSKFMIFSIMCHEFIIFDICPFIIVIDLKQKSYTTEGWYSNGLNMNIKETDHENKYFVS